MRAFCYLAPRWHWDRDADRPDDGGPITRSGGSNQPIYWLKTPKTLYWQGFGGGPGFSCRTRRFLPAPCSRAGELGAFRAYRAAHLQYLQAEGFPRPVFPWLPEWLPVCAAHQMWCDGTDLSAGKFVRKNTAHESPNAPPRKALSGLSRSEIRELMLGKNSDLSASMGCSIESRERAKIKGGS